MTVVGLPATGSHTYCPSCGYGTVIDALGRAVLVHRATCPDRPAGDQYVACRSRECRKVLDPERVRKHGAQTCDRLCRAAAWKSDHAYGRHDVAPQARANGRKRASGLQLPWRTAVAELAQYLAEIHGWDGDGHRATAAAAAVLRPALSERQRALLDERTNEGSTR